jgi:hypothetical protein
MLGGRHDQNMNHIYTVLLPTNCTINNKLSLVTYDVPPTCFGPVKNVTSMREKTDRPQLSTRTPSGMLYTKIYKYSKFCHTCARVVKIQSYQLKLLKCFKYRSITKILQFLNMYYPWLLTNVHDSFCHLHAHGVFPVFSSWCLRHGWSLSTVSL